MEKNPNESDPVAILLGVGVVLYYIYEVLY